MDVFQAFKVSILRGSITFWMADDTLQPVT